MNDNLPSGTVSKICPKCGTRIGGGRRLGSLTSYLLGPSYCGCLSAGDHTKSSKTSSNGQPDDDGDFCPKCGLRVVTNSRAGSLTAFLFQSTRCQCPRDKAFTDGRMGDEFLKLKHTPGVRLLPTLPVEAVRLGRAMSPPLTWQLAPPLAVYTRLSNLLAGAVWAKCTWPDIRRLVKSVRSK